LNSKAPGHVRSRVHRVANRHWGKSNLITRLENDGIRFLRAG
jgi:hypothetical protein